MIVMHVDIKIKPEMEQIFIEDTVALIKGSKAEPGNIAYDLVKVVGEEASYKFIEVWMDQEALDSHREQTHFLNYKAASQEKEFQSEDVKIVFYKADYL